MGRGPLIQYNPGWFGPSADAVGALVIAPRPHPFPYILTVYIL